MNNSDQAVINIYQVFQALNRICDSLLMLCNKVMSSVRDWVKMCSLACSVGIVHECSWSHDETKLACASASGLCQ